ncbi:ABC transporter ATP-binding protein [Caproiciproducens galactitolivorans]|uniref:Macrolide export ATP-binding/permease protein MacB n=1 Tax=Caproiciproducens galactitolivorans TaxID=642589 RepID=A0A4Z0YG74_9FIRM|nr:ABC transporter ATP-binding protein [Caproiciproducens galactitolivorans]QEY34788.1 ABC transporter ATP-binding protein [Caproiciproducens galactitolivorans]TGJ75962.1 macrolide export ATP-binding/permease protein MacB [Caproiciproducens galactitolivorans]
MEQIIKIKNLRKSYGQGENRQEVLKGISIEVGDGEFLAILGPSGSGKSTLMNVIGCMDCFDEGEYWLTGEPVYKMNDAELTRVRNRKIGFIFQRYHLIQKYTALQNTMMPLLIRGVSRREAAEQSMEKLKMLGIGEQRINHRPNELSGGQQQRIAIARALVGSPKLLLADEPTGALDRETGEEVLALFRQLNEMGNTIVMITHDLHVAKSAKRIVKIIDGQLYEGSKSELLD